jgi:hypothetical protein
MKDIDIAKQKLLKDSLTLCIVKDANVIYTSKDRGVYPIYYAVKSDNVDVEAAAVADKVTGKGAALLCAFGRIGALHTGVISKPALKVLEDNNIVVTYDKLVDNIKNRLGDGLCPVESLSKNIDNPQDVILPVEDFLSKVGML